MKTGFLFSFFFFFFFFFFFLLHTIYLMASCVQIPRAIGAFYHVWKWHNVQRARLEMRRCTTHALYQVMTTGPLPAPSKCKSGRFNVPRVMKTKFPATDMVFGVVSREGHIMPPHIFEVGLTVNTKVYLDVLKSVAISWCNQVAGGRLLCGRRTRRRPTSPKRPRLGFRRRAMTLYSSLTCLLLPRPEPAGLLRLVIRREHHQHDSHNTKARLIAAIRRVFAELPPALVEKACSQFRIRIEAKGGYIE